MTTFNYTPDIPDAQHDPSVDQPDMKINTNSIKNLIAVDHITFQAQNGGEHKSIHFNQDAIYTPTPPLTTPQLFTKSSGPIVPAVDLPQLFYYIGNTSQSSGQYSNNTNFGTYLLGGLILKGGSITMTSNLQTFTYSTLVPALQPFPNQTLAVFLTPASTATTTQGRVVAVTSTSFDVRDTTGHVFYFLAIGY